MKHYTVTLTGQELIMLTDAALRRKNILEKLAQAYVPQRESFERGLEVFETIVTKLERAAKQGKNTPIPGISE